MTTKARAQTKTATRSPVLAPRMEREHEVTRAPVQALSSEGSARLGHRFDAIPVATSAAGAEHRSGVPATLMARMESTLRADFSDVRLHRRSTHAEEMGAIAFTQGSDVHVAPGHWDPGTTRGQEILGHELWHVVQQRQGRVQPTGHTLLNDDATLESEADTMGRAAARGAPIEASAVSPAPAGASSGRGSAPLQMMKMKTFWRRRDCLKVAENDENKEAIAWARGLLNASPDETLSDDVDEARTQVGEILLALNGGSEDKNVRLVWHALGVTKDLVLRNFSGMGDLAVNANNRLTGRPGFLPGIFSAAESKGAPGRARRHVTAWHTIQAVINRMIRDVGLDEVVALAKKLRANEPAALAAEANKVMKDVKDQPELVRLALMLNSSRMNLWLGGGKENISINSVAGPLKKLVRELDHSEVSVREYGQRLRRSKSGTAKGRKARLDALSIYHRAKMRAGLEAASKAGISKRTILADLRGFRRGFASPAEKSAAEARRGRFLRCFDRQEMITEIVNRTFEDVLSTLEIDVKGSGAAPADHKLMFDLANQPQQFADEDFEKALTALYPRATAASASTASAAAAASSSSAVASASTASAFAADHDNDDEGAFLADDAPSTSKMADDAQDHDSAPAAAAAAPAPASAAAAAAAAPAAAAAAAYDNDAERNLFVALYDACQYATDAKALAEARKQVKANEKLLTRVHFLNCLKAANGAANRLGVD